MTTFGASHQHAWNTPSQVRAWLDELSGYDHPTKRFNFLESLRESLEVHGRLTEPQARALKDIWEEVVCGC